MYNETVKVANKIIVSEDLLDIFSLMNEKLTTYRKISVNEELQNKMLDYHYQKWSFRDSGSSLTFTVNFYDDTEIKFDNYETFISVFNNRLDEIKNIYVRLSLTYFVGEGHNTVYHSQHIYMWIYENKMDIDLSLDSDDKRLDTVYEFIKNKIHQAPPKYDEVIKNKSSINFKVGFALGLIPGIIITTLLLLVPTIRQVFALTYVLYPVCVLMLAMLIGFAIGGSKLNHLYKSIQPEQKYVGYDTNKGKSIYKDDIDKYIESSEILIGKNADNLKCRRQIMAIYGKYKNYLLPELGILLLLSIIVVFLK